MRGCNHIAFLQIQKETGVKLTYVPHKGGAPALKSVIGGQVMAGVNNLSDLLNLRIVVEQSAKLLKEIAEAFLTQFITICFCSTSKVIPTSPTTSTRTV